MNGLALLGATVGAVEHGNATVLVTLGADLRCLDRRRVDLTRNLPTHPYHHEGSWALGRYANSPWARPISLEEALALIVTVRAAARQGADDALAALAHAVPTVTGLAVRACPDLPESDEAVLRDHRAHLVADSAMYRRALGDAAQARGWRVTWYDRKTVRGRVAHAIGHRDVDGWAQGLGAALGAPWRAEHKLAAMAAVAASTGCTGT